MAVKKAKIQKGGLNMAQFWEEPSEAQRGEKGLSQITQS